MIDFKCPGCAKSFSVPDDVTGRKTKCPKCGAHMVVPAATNATVQANSTAAQPNVASNGMSDAKATSRGGSSSTKILLIAGGALLGIFLLSACLVTGFVIGWTRLTGGDPSIPEGGDAKVANGAGSKPGDGAGSKIVGGGDPKTADGAGSKGAGGDNSKTKGGDGSKGNAMEVTGKEIHEAYQANEVAADEKYKGKLVRIEGRLISIRSANGKPYLEVSGDFISEYLQGESILPYLKGESIVSFNPFRCEFDDNHKGALAKLSKGENIAVLGILNGRNGGMSNCAIVPATPAKPIDEAQVRRRNDLQRIGIAIVNYALNNNGRLPPAGSSGSNDPTGKPLLSWRVAILPYIDQQALYKEFDMDLAWDHPHNQKLVAKMPKLFALPGAEPAKGMTHYRTLVGPGTLLDPIKATDGKRYTRYGIGQIPGGSSQMITVVEATEPTIWTKPDDLVYDPKGPLPKFGVYPAGFQVVFADGSTQFVRSDVPENILRLYLTCDGPNR